MKTIKGEVIHGKKLGRTIGFPTANISYSKDDVSDSVFHTNVILDGKILRGMGTYMKKKSIFEVHIFDFNRDIYGKEIEIILLKKIRENKKFQSLEEIKQQIEKDQEIISQQELHTLTFGSFDVLHKGHEYYLSEARKYGTNLISIVATDKNIFKIKGHTPKIPLLERVGAVMRLGIANEVVAGSDTNPLQWITQYTPHTICLGYDQRGNFVDALPDTLQKLGLATEIIRIPAFHPETYKSSLLKKK